MKNIKYIIDVIKKLNYILDKKQKKASIIIFLFIIMGSLLEMLGVSAIFPLLQIIASTNEVEKKWYMELFVNVFHISKKTEIIVFMCILIALLYLLKNAFLVAVTYFEKGYSTKILKELSIKMLSFYMKKPYEFFTNTNSADILKGINNDTRGVYAIISDLLVLISEMLATLAIGIYLLTVDFWMAISIMLLALISILMITKFFKNKMRDAGKNNRYSYMLQNKCAYQAVNGIKEIKTINREEYFISRFCEAVQIARRSVWTKSFLEKCPNYILEGLCVSGFMVMACVQILFKGEMTDVIPTLGVFAVAAFMILPSLGKVASKINGIVFYIPSLNQMYIITNEMKSKEEFCQREFKNEQKEIIYKQPMIVDNVYWHYAGKDDYVLKGLSMSVEKGQTIGIIGKSGVGKTTLIDLILGLYKPQKGDITIDGISIFERPIMWSKYVGYVPQNVFLIDDSIRNNIIFGAEKNDESAVWSALEMAQLKTFVETLPDQLDTEVGERGIRFSGGQCQRLAIARALYHNPEILILDEATSALDKETEMALMDAIDSLKGKKTLIIIAHRISTILDCDKIYEIKDGKATIVKKEHLKENINN